MQSRRSWQISDADWTHEHCCLRQRPITHLWQIQQWTAFAAIGELHAAQQVADEVRSHVPLEQFAAYAGSSLQVHPIDQVEVGQTRSALTEGNKLQDADIATIVLCKRQMPALVLTDDLTLRRTLESLGLTPMGSVGLVLRAYTTRLTQTELRQAIDGLFVQSTLYLSPVFRAFVQREVARILEGPREHPLTTSHFAPSNLCVFAPWREIFPAVLQQVTFQP